MALPLHSEHSKEMKSVHVCICWNEVRMESVAPFLQPCSADPSSVQTTLAALCFSFSLFCDGVLVSYQIQASPTPGAPYNLDYENCKQKSFSYVLKKKKGKERRSRRIPSPPLNTGLLKISGSSSIAERFVRIEPADVVTRPVPT